MALIEIKELHLHVDIKSMNGDDAKKILNEIIKLENIMAKTKEELKAEFQAGFTEIKDSIANVAADIDRLVENTNPTGGLTEAEVEEQLTELRAISTSLKAVADKTPETPAEPQP
jgi:hypothetical protein